VLYTHAMYSINEQLDQVSLWKRSVGRIT